MQVDDPAEVAWSCVLDDTPAIWRSFFIWIATLTDCAAVLPQSIVVHHASELRADVRRLADRLGLRTQPIARFDRRSPHSNKIRQCASDFEARRVVLTDVDLAFLARPPIERITAKIAGKLVDLPNPPLEVLSAVFRLAGLPAPQLVKGSFVSPVGDVQSFPTFPCNFNGGFYVIDCAVLAELGSRWEHWARWMLEGGLIPHPYAVHVDQIAFCMAVVELGLGVQILGSAWNLPSHLLTPSGDRPPFVVHHHGSLDGLHLTPLKPPRHTEAIARANAAVSAFLARHAIDPP